MDHLSQIETKFSFTLPVAYRAFVERGYTTHPGDSYLWVHEAEWLSPKEILDREGFFGKPKPGLVAFAFTGGGGLWCWQTKRVSEIGEPAIAFCPRDCYEGWWHAPSFIGWLYRVSLEFVAPMWEDEAETKRHLRRWSDLIREFGKAEWADDLDEISERPPSALDAVTRQRLDALITPDELRDRVLNALGPSYIDAPYVWDLEGEHADPRK